MSTYELEHAVFDNNPHFDILGFNGDSVFVRPKHIDSVFKLRGKPTEWMLSLIAPGAWWRSIWPKRTKGMSASSAFVHAAYRAGLYDEVGIARRRIADEKRAAQPAPVLTESGLPAAFIVSETATHCRVKCPFCGDEHVHGARLGPRVPHCAMNYQGIGNYEIVRGDVASRK